MKKLLLILLCFLFIFSTCKKEEWKLENTINGYIEYYDIIHYDHANHTDVYLKNLSDSIIKQTSTTNKGEFEFNNILNGEYYIYAYRESNLTPITYEGYTDNFTIDGYSVDLETLTLNIILKHIDDGTVEKRIIIK
jgi:hypothetical protein